MSKSNVRVLVPLHDSCDALRFSDHYWAYHQLNADIEDLEENFVEGPDKITSPFGAKYLEEIRHRRWRSGCSNTIYHATGERIRDLPVTIDKLS